MAPTRIKQFASRLRRYLHWLADPFPVWCAYTVLAVPLSLAVAALMVEPLEARLRVAGVLLEVMGILTVALGIRKTRKQFALPSLLDTARHWIENRPPFFRTTGLLAGTASFNLKGSGMLSATGTTGVAPNATLEDRIKALEEKVDTTFTLAHEISRKLEKEGKDRAAALDSERGERSAGDEALRKLLQEVTAGGLHLEAVGVFWLLVGVPLANMPAELIKWFG